jgi:signal peptidase I
VKQARSSLGNSLVELVLIVAVALGLALGIQAFLVKPYRIPSPSMVPTLTPGQRVLVNRIGNNFGDPEVGDIIVFHPPVGADNQAPSMCGTQTGEYDPGVAKQPCRKPVDKQSDQTFIKRVVAGPGDTLRVQNGHVVRNGKLQKESFIAPCGPDPVCELPRTITIPKGYYFMMGDHRGESEDSRYWGPIKRDWIIGEAFATYWPPKRIGLL